MDWYSLSMRSNYCDYQNRILSMKSIVTRSQGSNAILMNRKTAFISVTITSEYLFSITLVSELSNPLSARSDLLRVIHEARIPCIVFWFNLLSFTDIFDKFTAVSEIVLQPILLLESISHGNIPYLSSLFMNLIQFILISFYRASILALS